MPVTARLSRKFYERFGDEIAGEFVDWFNAVDLTYQQQLRDLNDLNWERFKAEMDARFGEFRAEMGARFAQLEIRLAEKMAQSEARLTEKFSDKLVDTNIGISDMKSDMMKRMFIYWSGTVLSLGALIVALSGKS